MQLDGCIKMTFLDKNGIFHMGTWELVSCLGFVSTSQFLWPQKEKVCSAYLSTALKCCVFPRDVDIRSKKGFLNISLSLQPRVDRQDRRWVLQRHGPILTGNVDILHGRLQPPYQGTKISRCLKIAKKSYINLKTPFHICHNWSSSKPKLEKLWLILDHFSNSVYYIWSTS